MINILKHFIKFAELICVFFIPLTAIQYYFPNTISLDFLKNLNNNVINFTSTYCSQLYNQDWVIFFLTIPWVILVILLGVLLNILEQLSIKTDKVYNRITQIKILKQNEQKNMQDKELLNKKIAVYLAIELVFSKFTISNLSDEEITAQKKEIREILLKNINIHRGKLNEEEEFDNEDTFAILFYSQEDAIDYLIKLKESIRFLDDKVQQYGYSLEFKAILDIQLPEAIKFYVLQFLEKALKAVVINEIFVTSDFADKYSHFGKNKNINFITQGNYIINQSKVGLYKIEY